MSTIQPFGSGDNPIRQTFLSCLKPQYKGLTRSYAVTHMERISHYAKKNDPVSQVLARICAVAFPLYLGGSIIQLIFRTVADLTNTILNQQRTEQVVVYSEDDKGVSEFRNISTYKNLRELAFHVAATVPTILFYFPTIIAPGFYDRPSLGSVPPTKKDNAITAMKQKRSDTIKEHENAITGLKEEMRNKIFEDVWNAVPEITSSNVEVLRQFLDDAFEGIELCMLKDMGPNYYSHKTFERSRSKETSRPEKEKSLGREQKTQLLTPTGTIQLKIDCRKVSAHHLKKILLKSHEIHRLVLINPDIRTLLDDSSALETLSNIHTLVIEQAENLSTDQLTQLAEKYKNIACFDLSQSTLNETLETHSLWKSHMILYQFKNSSPNKALERKVKIEKSAKSNIKDNIPKHLLQLDQKLFDKTEALSKEHQTEQLRNFFEDKEGSRISPALPFVSCLSCFKKTTINAEGFKVLVEDIRNHLPNLRGLDFSACNDLDVRLFKYVSKILSIKELFLNDCQRIFFNEKDSLDIKYFKKYLKELTKNGLKKIQCYNQQHIQDDKHLLFLDKDKRLSINDFFKEVENQTRWLNPELKFNIGVSIAQEDESKSSESDQRE